MVQRKRPAGGSGVSAAVPAASRSGPGIWFLHPLDAGLLRIEGTVQHSQRAPKPSPDPSCIHRIPYASILEMFVGKGQVLLPVVVCDGVPPRPDMVTHGVHDGLVDRRHLIGPQVLLAQ